MIGLSVVTGWNLTRSDALAEAERAYARSRPGAAACSTRSTTSSDGPGAARRRCWRRGRLSRLDYAEQAEPYYRRAGRLSLDDQQIRAYGLVRGPHPERAIAGLPRDPPARSPDNVTAMRRLAAVLLAQNDKDQLLELADRLDRVPGGEVIGAMLRGTVYHNDQNPQMAVASFERVLQLDPELREMPASRKLFWNQLAADLVECGRIEDAGRYLEQALAAGPDAELINLARLHVFPPRGISTRRSAATARPRRWTRPSTGPT